MPRFSNNGFYNDEDLKSCIFCGGIADSKDHTPSRFLSKNIRDDQSRITVPCCKTCNNKFSAIELRCQSILNNFLVDSKSLTESQFSDLRTIAIKNAIGVIFHFYAVKLSFNSDIEFSIEINITPNIFLKNFIIWDFDISPSIESSLNTLMVFSFSENDMKGVIRDNVNEIGEIEIGYSKEPYCVKMIYRGTIGFTVKWN